MITESCLNHLDSLVKRSKTYEEKMPKWDEYQVLSAGGGGISLTLFGIMLAAWLIGPSPNILGWAVLWVLFLVSCFVAGLSYHFMSSNAKLRTAQHSSFLDEVGQILKTARDTLDHPQGSQSQYRN